MNGAAKFEALRSFDSIHPAAREGLDVRQPVLRVDALRAPRQGEGRWRAYPRQCSPFLTIVRFKVTAEHLPFLAGKIVPIPPSQETVNTLFNANVHSEEEMEVRHSG